MDAFFKLNLIITVLVVLVFVYSVLELAYRTNKLEQAVGTTYGIEHMKLEQRIAAHKRAALITNLIFIMLAMWIAYGLKYMFFG